MNRLQSLRMKVKGVLTVLPAALLIALGVLLSVLLQSVQGNSSSLPDLRWRIFTSCFPKR